MTSRTHCQILFVLLTIQQIYSQDDGYLRFVKDGCFVKGEAMSCVKYKALKIAKSTIFGDMRGNETIKANDVISFVPLDEDIIKELAINDEVDVLKEEPRSVFSEWTQLAKYFVKLVQDFFKMKGVRVSLPDGARTIEEKDSDNGDGRGRRKKLAVIVPLLTLLAALKTKLLLIPILLAVLLIKKLLLIAALLLPSLLSTLKHCKHHPMTHYSYFGSNDASDISSDYGSSYNYASGGGYGKDWASNRAYNIAKHRPTPAPVYITAPGNVA